MGVSSTSWEIQWHPASGRAVRRFRLTSLGMAWIAIGAALLVLLVVFMIASVGVGVWGVSRRLSLDVVRHEAQQLRAEGAQLREELLASSWRVANLLGKGRRLAWVLGEDASPPQFTAPPPPADVDDGEQVEWLLGAAEELHGLGGFLEAAFDNAPLPVGSLPTGSPLEPTQAVPVALYGRHISPFTGVEESHHGVTWAALEGEPVRAAGAARVMWAGSVRERRANQWTRFGLVVILDHGGGVYSVYGHMGTVAVRRGQRVQRGDRLGEVGQTGWTRTPGLYWEVRWPVDGVSRPVDPALVNLALPMEDLAGRLANPAGDLDGGFAGIERFLRLR